MSLKATIAELILNATAAGRAMLTAADAAAQKVLLSLSKSDVGLGNVDNTSDANKPVSTATAAALSGKQATLVSGTNIRTVNSTSLLGSGDIVISAGIGGSTGATDNRVLRSDGTGGATVQNSPVTIDDSGNVSGVGTLTATGTANAGSQVLRVQGSGSGFTRLNDNGTVIIDGDVSSGSTPLSVRYNGTEQWGISSSGILSGRSGCTLNIGAGQMHLTHSGSLSQVKTFGNLALLPGNLGGGGTSVDVTGSLTASGNATVASLTVNNSNSSNIGVDVRPWVYVRSNSGTLVGYVAAGVSIFSSGASGATDFGFRAVGAFGISVNNSATPTLTIATDGSVNSAGLMCAGAYTVATLPSASANAGKFAQVTDSSVTTFRSTVAGGGSNRVPVFSDGTNWVVA